MTEKAYESVTFGEAVTGVLEIPKVAIEGIWRFSEMSNIFPFNRSGNGRRIEPNSFLNALDIGTSNPPFFTLMRGIINGK
ncbi:hypothetical protein PL9214640124 [Planktothrix tepida PCC 9214]|uniref:Uncharacterized protein n=1 Tax=Planktothrix tepida PCC 9214 TaxID=671072 RepID=A0A1J1LNG6_9CYAN|nr:hypothetical protein PL9214640124 [Planktothrix tepida PCC 9214]